MSSYAQKKDKGEFKQKKKTPAITRQLADKQIEDMKGEYRQISPTLYLFPKYGDLRVKLKEGKTIDEWIVKYVESRNNIKNIENALKNNTHAKKKK